MGLKSGQTRKGLRNLSTGVVAIPDSELDHQWLHDEGSGTTLTDSEGSLNASIDGATWGTGAGVGDTYLSYDGTDDRAGTGSTTAGTHFVNDGEGTFFVWLRPTDIGNDRFPFGTGVYTSSRCIDWRGDSIQIAGSSGRIVQLIDIGLTENEWQSVAVQLDGTEGTAYVDGLQSATDTISYTESGDWRDTLRWGVDGGDGSADGSRYYQGDIDRTWITSSIVSEPDIQDWHDATKGDYQ